MVDVALRRITSVKIPSGPPEKSQGIWKSLLEGTSRTAEFEDSTLLFLGRKDAGKASLIRAMQKIGSGSRPLTDMEVYGETHGVAGIDYAYMTVRAVDDADLAESLALTDIWILQDADHRHLLSPLISPTHLRHLIVIICLDLSEPWTLRAQLRHWLDFAATFIQDLMKDLPADEQDALRFRLSRYINTYRSKVEGKSTEDGFTEDTTLKVNLGVPFVVCVCKSDFAASLDTRNYPGRADAVLAHLRNICLPYGAALIYNSSKSTSASRNIEVLYRYLVHRVYDFKFLEPATWTCADSIFIPSGWDSESEIKTFAAKTVAENLETPLEALLPPSADARGVADQLQKTIDVTAMNDFLEALLGRDPTLAVKDRSSPGGSRQSSRQSSANAPVETQLAAEKRESAPRESKRSSRGVPTVEIGSSDATGARVSSSKRHMDSGSSKGDSESLRAFFQTLLTKPGQSGTTNPRPSSPRPDGDEKKTREESSTSPTKRGASTRKEEISPTED